MTGHPRPQAALPLPLTHVRCPQGTEEDFQINSWTQFKAQRRQVLALQAEVAELREEVERVAAENRALRAVAP